MNMILPCYSYAQQIVEVTKECPEEATAMEVSVPHHPVGLAQMEEEGD